MTVIDNNAWQMGELAARLLLTRLEQSGAVQSGAVPAGMGGSLEFSEFRAGGRLVERDSCPPLREGGG